MSCSIGGRPRISRWRRLRRAADETFCMFAGPNQIDVRLIQNQSHWSSFTVRVSEATSWSSAKRPEASNEIGAEGGERRRKRFLVGEVKLAEDETGRGAIKEKVVPLYRGADPPSD